MKIKIDPEMVPESGKDMLHDNIACYEPIDSDLTDEALALALAKMIEDPEVIKRVSLCIGGGNEQMYERFKTTHNMQAKAYLMAAFGATEVEE